MIRQSLLLLISLSAIASADEPLPRIPPKEPAEALKTFKVRDGFSMQLIAAEPLVASPVAMEYDENGRAYVAEMRDYPYTDKASDKPFTERTKDEPLGRIRLLEDTDGDGRFDKSTIFAEGLSWPTGLALWKGGVYVVATPDLWYLKDTDGDGKADVRRKVFTGFRKFNVQAVINNLKWGLDGKIYGAGSSNGGQIRRGDDPTATPVVMPTADFRFDPRDEKFELISGGARFGNTFDDWGNRFICNIRNPIQHVVLPRKYLARNPHWPARSALQDVAEAGDTLPVFRISAPEPWRVLNARRLSSDPTIASPRSETVATGYMTSASGLTIYRGDAYPPEFYGTAFLGEVAGNVIHHQVLKRNGVTFTSTPSNNARRTGGVSLLVEDVPPPGETRGLTPPVRQTELQPAEFVASTDNWFRPVNFVNAPDGMLHVLDMYRETIEHPWSIPDDIKAQLDLESGRDRGRIYRLTPAIITPVPRPRLDSVSTFELIAHLANRNVWWRETARRLLLERQDPETVVILRDSFRYRSKKARPPFSSPMTNDWSKFNGLWVLANMQALSDADLLVALDDSHPRVREAAVLLSEPRLSASAELLDKVLTLAADWEVRVRWQVALSLGEVVRDQSGQPRRPVITALANIAERDCRDEWLRTAVFSSTGEVLPALVTELVGHRGFGVAWNQMPLVRGIAEMIGSRARPDELEQLFAAVDSWDTHIRTTSRHWPQARFVQEVMIGLGEGLKRAKKSLTFKLTHSKSAGAAKMFTAWGKAMDSLGNPKAAGQSRADLVPLLAFAELEHARELLAELLQRDQPLQLQSAAVRVLAGHRHAEAPTLLLAAIRQLAPAARGEAVEALLSRPDAHVALLDAVQAGDIALSDIPHVRRNLLVRSTNPAVKERAIAMFTVALASRQKAVEKYRAALTTLTPDRANGDAVVRRECMACHRVGEVGTEIGPNLRTIRHRAAEEVLLQILDPNREVGPNYVAYAVVTDEGRVSVGLIVEETAHSITLLRPTGTRETILRANIEELAALGKSLMPEGLEEKITPQEMADLLEWLLK